MRFGINTFVWVSPCTTAAVKELAPKVRDMGFDVLEVACENPDLIDPVQVKEVLDENGLQGIICGVFGPDRNICSQDAAIVENAKRYLRWLIDAAAEIGSPVVCGPMYSAVGKEHLEEEAARYNEWKKAVEGIREKAIYAKQKGIKLALEPLNRFENDMINVVAQGLKFCEETGMENVGLHLDSFHMHLEEKNSGDAIRSAGKRLFHFHACENDRGIPGTGQVRWEDIAKALKDIKYDGAVVIESFTPQVKEIARAVCIWREIAPSQDTLARDGLKFLKRLLTDA
ncbi:sugar phosphate isomerase/epimerase family protein [Thermanaerothrix sp. 4228-RoL]|uniref:Sugar phosphate isomerase/epimerase family protein n=1 Tax=Thermanaerothrix solaris TaxID=3058434 RepID=A0ABU3NS74_9CHLR|nr:sugar phosphate isomerase/epimerase family protein [Thermanaerothrix sp. 4228-RoL]MDT8898937.1 sugar phosphate isomerase/epimerase family protein [Thermanaerothrix sp. 4228-RoL]